MDPKVEDVCVQVIEKASSKKASKRSREETKKETFKNPFLQFENTKSTWEWYNIYTPVMLPDFEAMWEKFNTEMLSGKGRLAYAEVTTKVKMPVDSERVYKYSTVGLVRIPKETPLEDFNGFFDGCPIIKAVFKNRNKD